MRRKTYDLVEVCSEDNGKSLEEIKPSLKKWFEDVLEYGRKLDTINREASENTKVIVGDG